jgi:hypothetical protein
MDKIINSQEMTIKLLDLIITLMVIHISYSGKNNAALGLSNDLKG